MKVRIAFWITNVLLFFFVAILILKLTASAASQLSTKRVKAARSSTKPIFISVLKLYTLSYFRKFSECFNLYIDA